MGLHVRVEVVHEHFVVARCGGCRLELAKSQLDALPAADAPRILGVEMNRHATGGWVAFYGCVFARITQGNGYQWEVAYKSGASTDLAVCIAAIERELLAIRDAIPVPARGARWKDGDGPVKCFTCEAMVPEPSVCDACYARAAEPPQPASIGGVCLGCGAPFASPDFDQRCSSCVESGTGPEAVRPLPASVGGVTPGAVLERVADALNAVSFFNAGLSAKDASMALMVARRIVEDVETELYELSKKTKPTEPPHPSTEELVATVSEGLCSGVTPGDRHKAWSALSELKRLVMVKP